MTVTIKKDLVELLQSQLGSDVEAPPADVRVVTSGGMSIHAHSKILGSVSTVLENLLLHTQLKPGKSQKVIKILGVPREAVVAFLRFLYSSRCTDEEMNRYGMHLLTLGHVYSVPQLKMKCSKGLAARMTVDNVVDVLQLARLCDASDLYLKCLKMVSNEFKNVEKTEAWKFLQNHDPWLELEILKLLDEMESRENRLIKVREEQNLYLQLSEAMECLDHICTQGCTSVGPYDKEPSNDRRPCHKFSTCQAVQNLIRHFAKCKKRVNGRCIWCVSMWQLLKLHSSLCDEEIGVCRVPLCRQFQLKTIQRRKGGEARWRLLARKVVSAKVMSTLSLAKVQEKGRYYEKPI